MVIFLKIGRYLFYLVITQFHKIPQLVNGPYTCKQLVNQQNIKIISNPGKISDYPLKERTERNHETIVVRKFKYISGDFEPWISSSLLIGEASCGVLWGSCSILLNILDFIQQLQSLYIFCFSVPFFVLYYLFPALYNTKYFVRP